MKTYCTCEYCGGSTGINANVEVCLVCELEIERIERAEKQAQEVRDHAEALALRAELKADYSRLRKQIENFSAEEKEVASELLSRRDYLFAIKKGLLLAP